ncbi:hypothetical protein BUE80_DR012251 [Diplocarpon rosae]|nr:hypothetical protein BUE80_DR012251 [Diplocarpon rosae]
MLVRRPVVALGLYLASTLDVVSGFLHAIHDDTFVPDAVIRITEEHRVQSCLPAKPIVLINGTSPGPELTIREGGTYWIRVYNDLAHQNLTMHWHGLTMAASPLSDGTPQASQWPIPPLKFFDYELNVPVGMAGTYFYHSHVGLQAISATGPLIVKERFGHGPYHYDEERTLFLQDVFQRDDASLEAGLVATPLVWSGEASMILINGQGAGNFNGTTCNATLAALDVQPGKTYRLRIIGGTALTFATFAIEGHDTMTVIEADGSYTEPFDTAHIQIGSGQRYSVLLTTKLNPEKSTYMIQFETRDRPAVTRSFAVLNYGAPSPPTIFYPPAVAPLTLPPTDTEFLDYKLCPHHLNQHMAEMPQASEVTRTVVMTVHQRVDGRTTWVQNNFPWDETVPDEPYLISMYRNDAADFPSMERALANDGIDPQTRIFPAQLGEVLEIVIQNTGADRGGLDVHPFHFHGAHYWDLGAGNGSYDQARNEAKWARSPGHPIKRDTSMLYRYGLTTTPNAFAGWRVWRIRVTQPGVWMLHCHILPHMVMGMQTVWVMGTAEEVMGRVPRPDVEGYLTFGGDVVGDERHWPAVVEGVAGAQWTNDQ